MSLMKEAIDRISIYAERKSEGSLYDSMLAGVLHNNGYSSFSFKSTGEFREFGKEFESELQQHLSNSPPTLTAEQIKEITKDYPFELPVEMYELYQRGNGLLPIGLNHPPENDFNIYKYYFVFPDEEIPLIGLRESMRLYQVFNEYRENYQRDIDPKWFPISIFEDMLLAVIGSEEQQQQSPVIRFYDSKFISTIEWLSLTDMLLYRIEIAEANLKNCTKAETKEILKTIYEKYSRCGGLDWILQEI